MSAFWTLHIGAAGGRRCRVLLKGAVVTAVGVLWSGHARAAAGRRCRVLLSEWCGCKVLSQGAAVRMLQVVGVAVTVACTLWNGHTGVTAGFR